MTYIPSVNTNRVGQQEASYHAQVISDAFTKALSDSNCISQALIDAYLAADDMQSQIDEITEMLGDRVPKEPSNEYTAAISIDPISQYKDSSTISTSNTNENSQMTYAFKERFKQECIDCGFDNFPDFDLDLLLSALMGRTSAFIQGMQGLFGQLGRNHCHLTYMLSGICLPDLIKLLAIVLAALVKLLASFAFGSMGIVAFVSGIIGAILSTLFRYVMTLMSFAISPIGCLVNSLRQVSSSLPTKNNVRDNLGKQERALIGLEDEGEKDIVEEYNDSVAEQYLNFNKEIDTSFEWMSDKVEKSYVSGMLETISDLLGMFEATNCENGRTGVGSVEKIQATADLIEVANLLSSIIDKKSKRDVHKDLCLGISEGSSNPVPFSMNDIAEVIGNAYNRQVEVITDENGELGVLIKDKELDNNPVPRLEMNSCDLGEFTRANELPAIIERAVTFTEDQLIGEGLDPSVSFVPSRPIESLTEEEIKNMLVMNPNGAGDNITQIIDEVLDFRRNNTVEPNNDILSVLLNDPYWDKDKVPSLKEAQDAISDINTKPSSPQRRRKDSIETFSNRAGKTIQLKCGTVTDLVNKINLVKN